LTGRKITHPIESFSKASDEQIIKLFKAGGPAFADKMKDFFPVVVKLTNDMNDLILVDNKG
jgi:sorbitol-specific phosphotransferase system component IIC